METHTPLLPTSTDAGSEKSASDEFHGHWLWLQKEMMNSLGEDAKFPSGLKPTKVVCCGGIKEDYRRRWRFCRSDFVDGFTAKTLAAILFMFFATFACTWLSLQAPEGKSLKKSMFADFVVSCDILATVALGEVAERTTSGMIGISEYLILQGGAGFVIILLNQASIT